VFIYDILFQKYLRDQVMFQKNRQTAHDSTIAIGLDLSASQTVDFNGIDNVLPY
jgi:hypothetical protein